MQAHKTYIRQLKVTWIKPSSWAWFSIHNSTNSEAMKSIKDKTYCQQRRTRPTLLWLKNDPHKEWTSQAWENLGMLCYTLSCFLFCLKTLGSWKRQLQTLPCRDSWAQSSRVHFTHTFPSSTTPKWQKDLCFCTAQTSASVSPVPSPAGTGDAFWGRMPSMEAAMDCCGVPTGPSPPPISAAAL